MESRIRFRLSENVNISNGRSGFTFFFTQFVLSAVRFSLLVFDRLFIFNILLLFLLLLGPPTTTMNEYIPMHYFVSFLLHVAIQ